MRVVVTGGAGFLGALLVEELLRRGRLRGAELAEVVVVDAVEPAEQAERVRAVVGDVAEPGLLSGVLATPTDVVFHLAAVVSGQAEADPELSARVNLDGSRLVLQAAGAAGRAPVVVFASSLAVYGGALPEIVDDETVVRPQSTYGTHKAAAELLLADHTRRGDVDGRAVRLPTVSVRPGRPNRAASSFLSGIVREPVAGTEAVCPVPPETVVWLTSPQRAVEGLVGAAELDSAAIGAVRTLNLPGVSVSVGEMVSALGRLVGPAAAALVRWERDPAIEDIVATWPTRVDCSRAAALGLPGERDFDDLLRAYLRRVGRS